MIKQELIKDVEQWFIDRNLHNKEPKKQLMKLVEEFGELTDGINKDNDIEIIDAIGDMIVVMIGLSLQMKFEIELFNTPISNDKWSAVLGLIDNLNYYIKEDNKIGSQSTITQIINSLNAIAKYYETNVQHCLEHAYNEIKNRTGKVIDGIYVKDEPKELKYFLVTTLDGSEYKTQIIGTTNPFPKTNGVIIFLKEITKSEFDYCQNE